MPHQKHLDYNPAMVRLRKIFHDADISLQTLQVVGSKGQYPGEEATFVVDLGYPTHFVASMFVSNKELCQSSNAKLLEIVSLRTDAVVRYLLQETGRTERPE